MNRFTAAGPPAATNLFTAAGPPAARSLTSRPVAIARFLSLVYVFVLAFLVLAAVIPTLVAGWRPLSVVSGSMHPAVASGSLVIVAPAEADEYYAAPTIIACADPARPGRLLTHRVTDTASQAGTVVYTTKGDANRMADSDPVMHGDVIGAVRMVIPFLGLPATWLHAGQGAHLVLWLVASVVAVAALIVRVRP